MRKDIEIHIQTGDVTVTRQNTYKAREFRWVNNPSGLSRYIYGEIDIPALVTLQSIQNHGFYFAVPYTPVYKEMMVRVRRVQDGGAYEYVLNGTNGTEWFLVKTGLYGKEQKNVFVSQLQLISEEALYGRIDGGDVVLYGCEENDFNIVNADRQNANCMLACLPSNNYRYPLAGVGLVRWVNASNAQGASLAETVKREFEADGVFVNDAGIDYDTNQLSMDAKTID